jgi:death-on-curing protein
MSRRISLAELLRLYFRLLEHSDESGRVKDFPTVLFAFARARARWEGREFYPTPVASAAALCDNLAALQGFSAGNLRVAHAALETTLVLNGFELDAPLEEQERVMRAVADEQMDQRSLAEWVTSHCRALPDSMLAGQPTTMPSAEGSFT